MNETRAKRPTPAIRWVAGVALLVMGCASVESTPVQRVRPFTYLLAPHDTIGFKECPNAFQIAPDGALVSAWGQWHLWTGQPARPADQRTRLPREGYLPMLSYVVLDGEVTYTVEVFGAPHGLDPRDNLMAYISVTAHNEGDQDTTARAQLVWGPKPSDGYRARLECREAWYCEQFHDAASWSASGVVTLRDDGVLEQAGHAIGRVADEARGPTVSASDGTATVAWDWDLGPLESARGVLVVPFAPIAVDRGAQLDKLVGAAAHDQARDAVAAFWRDELTRGMVISLDEDKVVHQSRTSLAYNMIARDIQADGQSVLQTVGENMYPEFWSRDAAFFTRTYLMFGRPELARGTLEHFVQRDAAGDAVGIERFYPDDWGQSLWAIGSYLRSTGDVAFATELLAAVEAHVDSFEAEIATDPLQIWPAAGPYDNETLEFGHYTGHSFWALLGLTEAAHLASTAGDGALAGRIEGLALAYRARFDTQLETVTRLTGGYIPPGLDDPAAGFDWANASGGVYPFGVHAPDDPRVTATLALLRPAKYREGLLFFGTNAWALSQGRPVALANLHGYLTHYVTETLLARGEQRAVVEDFYAILAHSSSTHAGFEHSLTPWGSRDASWNRGPHGWYAARFNELLRNMLLREGVYGDDTRTLHVASAVSPVWAAPGKSIVVERGDTFFGTVERLELRYTDAGLEVSLTADWRQPPDKVVVHAPFWTDGAATTFTAAEAGNGTLKVPFAWGDAPDLSYERAVEVIERGFGGGPRPNVLLAP